MPPADVRGKTRKKTIPSRERAIERLGGNDHENSHLVETSQGLFEPPTFLSALCGRPSRRNYEFHGISVGRSCLRSAAKRKTAQDQRGGPARLDPRLVRRGQ